MKHKMKITEKPATLTAAERTAQTALMKQALSWLIDQAVKCVCRGGRNQDWCKAAGQEFYVVYFLDVQLGAQTPARFRYEGRLPFAPNAGMYIEAIKFDDSREIEQVYWTGQQFEVYLKTEDCVTGDRLRELGWREAKR